MKFLIAGCITGILGLAILFLAAYLGHVNGWRSAPEIILSIAISMTLVIFGFKMIVWAVLKWDNF